MWQGSVVSISIAPGESESTRLMEEVRAISGRGLEGDRYCKPEGEAWDDPGREITFIAAEAIEAMAEENGLKLDYKDARRNIITRGVPLNDLIDQEFAVGNVRVRGVRLNDPCKHLASLTDQRILKGLVHRGGLRAQILNDGVIRVGDAVTQS